MLNLYNMDPDFKDFRILDCISPPSAFSPTSLDISIKIQQTFYSQCQHFLKAEKNFYQCNKRVENRLSSAIEDAVSLDERIRQRSNKLELISRDLRKVNQHQAETEEKEEFLKSVCKFVNMEEARKIMLQNKISDEDEFIQKLREVDQISQELAILNSDIKIIVQVKEELSSLLLETVDKMIKGSISDKLIRKITSDFSEPFLRDSKIAQIFITNLTNHRVNFFRLGLNPLINNISYVQNVAELYDKITQQWVRMLGDELKIFKSGQTPRQIQSITREVMSRLVAEAVPKMERGIYKLKSIVDMSKIRSCLVRLKDELDKCGECVWDPLPKLLMKIFVILEEKLEDGAEKLEIAKYNIYSLASYVPIREYLEQIKQARMLDCKREATGWERGFKRLADSRDPTKQPNNKSLTIFNLNIWYLYSHVMKQEGEMIQRAEAMIRQNIHSIINLNLVGLKKDYDSKALHKLVDLCADIQSLKKILYSEINLLGHQKLRSIVERELISRFITEIYTPMLTEHNLTGGLENAVVLQLSKREKLNLNKYGKGSEYLRIFTPDEMKQLLS